MGGDVFDESSVKGIQRNISGYFCLSAGCFLSFPTSQASLLSKTPMFLSSFLYREGKKKKKDNTQKDTENKDISFLFQRMLRFFFLDMCGWSYFKVTLKFLDVCDGWKVPWEWREVLSCFFFFLNERNAVWHCNHQFVSQHCHLYYFHNRRASLVANSVFYNITRTI